MKFINGWRFLFKENDRVHIEFRVSILTVFKLFLDFGNREFSVMVMNFGVKFKGAR